MNSYLTALIAELPSDHLITITGAIAPLRNGDVHYPFRQDSDFLYLTGLSVPGLILTIFSDQIILWREAITDLDRVWGSDKISDNEIVRIAGIVDIRDRSDLELYRSGKKETNDDAVRDIIHSLRLIKTPDEIEKIRQAISISQEAFSHIESILQP